MEEQKKNDRWEQFNLIIDNGNLNYKEKGLLLILFRFVNYKTGYANPSRELIKKLYGTKKNDVIDKVLNSLIEKGFISRETGKGTRSKYFIKVGTQIEPSSEIEPSSKKEPLVGTQIEPPVGSQIEPPVGTQIEPQKEKEKKIKKKKEKKIYIDLSFIKFFISNVNLTREEFDNLIMDFGEELVHRKIIDFDNYVESNPKKYKNHFKALYSWCQNENETIDKFSSNSNGAVPGYENIDWNKFNAFDTPYEKEKEKASFDYSKIKFD